MRGTIVLISKMFTHVCNASSRIPSSNQRDWLGGRKAIAGAQYEADNAGSHYS
jgi:hypothetical protein